MPFSRATPVGAGRDITTDSGILHGLIDPSSSAVRQFLGVPFALPPTGARRWLPLMGFNNSSVSINTTAFGSACPQIPLSTQLTPEVFSAKGGNRTEFFPHTQGHIVVSANYRVNTFGFPNAPGLTDLNLGPLDQRTALEWVRTNIGAMGAIQDTSSRGANPPVPSP
ncbi:Alpha/Beta hydrolase protein [Mycena metata]|uniref:Alpha/Beta hydrolase protein n=1 Tax=Mycena metata TaxID=1033252 RepID=A0AAD7HMJ3_9AGAR|nr:Alpha/Beta hydrolase protein [Mycena metata]